MHPLRQDPLRIHIEIEKAIKGFSAPHLHAKLSKDSDVPSY
jgi:hypothetical protein